MKRIAILQQDPAILHLLYQIEAAERDRLFCRHGLPHLLDTARIAWIEALERGLPLEKPVVYAAALLHDLGRAAEYAGLGDHDTAALDDCRVILLRSGFEANQIEEILQAIASHGDKSTPDSQMPALSAILRRADGLSRPCYRCDAAAECHWPESRRNHHITV